MADVVHTEGSGGNTVAVVAIVLLVGVAILFFMYVLPSLRQQPAPEPEGARIEVELPPPTGSPSAPPSDGADAAPPQDAE